MSLGRSSPEDCEDYEALRQGEGERSWGAFGGVGCGNGGGNGGGIGDGGGDGGG